MKQTGVKEGRKEGEMKDCCCCLYCDAYNKPRARPTKSGGRSKCVRVYDMLVKGWRDGERGNV